MREIELAPGWRVTRVREALTRQAKKPLIQFLRDRYRRLYFEPIFLLDKESRTRRGANSQEEWHFGFAITALCCLLVETFQCYRLGLPSSHRRELQNLSNKLQRIPLKFRVPETEWPHDGGEIFRCFFSTHRKFFPGIEGGEFYHNIRNGLLHQSQTKGKWRLKVTRPELWNKKSRTLDRERLAKQLKNYFEAYLIELQQANHGEQIWKNARRKIWWLAKLSALPG